MRICGRCGKIHFRRKKAYNCCYFGTYYWYNVYSSKFELLKAYIRQILNKF